MSKSKKLFSLTILMILLIICWRTEGFFGGADNYNHFKMARDLFNFPNLIFNLWGKPVYIALMSLPAQLGVSAVKFTNAFLAFSTAILVKKILDQWQVKNSHLSIVFVLFAPVYTALSCSALTEIIFSLILVLSLSLYSKEKYLLGSIIISFLPFARLEGFGILLLFGVYLLFKRKWFILPLLIFGTVLLSFAGKFEFDSYLWIIEKWPHPYDSSETYGRGDVFHFVRNVPRVLGWPIALLFLLGVFKLFKNFKNNHQEKGSPTKEGYGEYPLPMMLLILAIIGMYFSAHSYLWWKGQGGSAGLLRVLGGVTPLMSMIAFIGWHEWLGHKLKKAMVAFPIYLMLSIFLIVYALITYHLPAKLSPSEITILKALNWHEKNLGVANKLYYLDAAVYTLGKENREDKLIRGVPNSSKTDYGLNDGNTFIWTSDSNHELALEKFQKNDFIKTLKVFQPEVKEGENPNFYRVYLFCAGKRSSNSTNLFNQTFEDVLGNSLLNIDQVDSTKSFTEGNVYLLDKNHIFSPTFSSNVNQLNIDIEKFNEIVINFQVYSEHEFSDNEFALVGAMERNKQMYFYQTVTPKNSFPKSNKWNNINLIIPLPDVPEPNDKISIYIWYKGESIIWIDDFTIDVQ